MSLSFIFPHPPEVKTKTQNTQTFFDSNVGVSVLAKMHIIVRICTNNGPIISPSMVSGSWQRLRKTFSFRVFPRSPLVPDGRFLLPLWPPGSAIAARWCHRLPAKPLGGAELCIGHRQRRGKGTRFPNIRTRNIHGTVIFTLHIPLYTEISRRRGIHTNTPTDVWFTSIVVFCVECVSLA